MIANRWAVPVVDRFRFRSVGAGRENQSRLMQAMISSGFRETIDSQRRRCWSRSGVRS